MQANSSGDWKSKIALNYIERISCSDPVISSLTGLTIKEFQSLLPIFTALLRNKGVAGGKHKHTLATEVDKLFFILFYLKCYPTFKVAALFYGVHRSQPHRWVKMLLPLLGVAWGWTIDLPKHKIRTAEELTQQFPSIKHVFTGDIEQPVQHPKKVKSNIGRKERKNIMSNIESINPSTGKVRKTIPCTSISEVHTTIARCRETFATWRATSPDDRIALFEKLAALLEKNAEDLMALISEETGKRHSDAEYEIFDIIDGIRHYSRQLKLITVQDHTVPLSFLPHGTKFDTIPELRFEPHGVVAVIMPWNFPVWIPMVNIIVALLAGNTVVFKPSEYSTDVGIQIVKLFKKAGFPTGVLELVVGADEVGKALTKGDVDFIFFTGSVEAGLDVRRNSGMKPIDVELGGNSASIICEDAPLELAVEGTVWGALYNVGQSCSGHKRVYVHKNVADKFKKMVVEKVKSLRPMHDYGPYIRRSEMMKVHERVQEAVSKGAKLLCGGCFLEDLPEEFKDGYWYAPTVLEYQDDDLTLVRTETFGNVLPIRVVESEDEAITLANDTDYGLNNILWTSDLEKGQGLADRLESGMVFINEAELALVAGEYWGGWKNSGIGGVGSKLMKCFRQKLLITYTKSEPREYWFPYK